MSTITLSKSDAAGVRTDAVVIGVVKVGGGVALPAGTESLNAAYGGKLVEVLSGLGATGKAGRGHQGARRRSRASRPTLIAVGLGEAPDGALKTEDLRTAAGTGVRAPPRPRQSVAFALPTPDADASARSPRARCSAATRSRPYKSSDGATEAPGAVTVLTDLARNKEAKAALERAEVTADAVHQVRDWVNTPPSDLNPADFAAAGAEARQGVRRQGRGDGREGPAQGRVRRHPRRRPGLGTTRRG